MQLSFTMRWLDICDFLYRVSWGAKNPEFSCSFALVLVRAGYFIYVWRYNLIKNAICNFQIRIYSDGACE